MRCLACGAEMHCVHVVQDDTFPVPGFERRTFMCSGCGDVERRLAFTKDARQSRGKPEPVHPAPPIAPASSVPNQHHAVSDVVKRVFARLRSGNGG
jgi:hypothetical protein